MLKNSFIALDFETANKKEQVFVLLACKSSR